MKITDLYELIKPHEANRFVILIVFLHSAVFDSCMHQYS